jgi:anti-sigma regulatory factor (Ser/Thr protein kinase)
VPQADSQVQQSSVFNSLMPAEPVCCTKNVLWIEPDSHVRYSLGEFVSSVFNSPYVKLNWHSSETLEQALPMVDSLSEPVDVLLIEPSYPMDQLSVWLTSLRQRYPHMQVSFLTQLTVEEYLPLCKTLDVHHVLLKSIPFCFQEFQQHLEFLTVPQLSTQLDVLVQEPVLETLSFQIQNSDDIMLVFSSLNELAQQRLAPEACAELCTPLLEGLTNAVYHAYKDEYGHDKYAKGSVVEALLEHEYVDVYFVETASKVAVSILDQGGTLNFTQVMYWLARNITGEGIFDETGRGLFLMYTLMDGFYLTVQPQAFTMLTLIKHKTDALMNTMTDVSIPNRKVSFYHISPTKDA